MSRFLFSRVTSGCTLRVIDGQDPTSESYQRSHCEITRPNMFIFPAFWARVLLDTDSRTSRRRANFLQNVSIEMKDEREDTGAA